MGESGGQSGHSDVVKCLVTLVVKVEMYLQEKQWGEGGGQSGHSDVVKCLGTLVVRVETYLQEKQWEKAVVTLDIQMQQPAPSTQLQLLKVRHGASFLRSMHSCCTCSIPQLNTEGQPVCAPTPVHVQVQSTG